MATRSTIWLKENEQSYIGIYCHWDGYLDHNGEILFQHYGDVKKVKDLINLGHISILGERLIPKGAHTFEAPEDGVTVFYHRDRGEDLKKYKEPTLSHVKLHNEQYNYLFQENEWFVIGKSLVKLKELLN